MERAIGEFPLPDTDITYNVSEAPDENWNRQWEQDGFVPIVISDEYIIMGYGNQGLIPAINEDKKYGLITYDNRIVVPFEYDNEKLKEIVSTIKTKAKEVNNKYSLVIKIDRPYV